MTKFFSFSLYVVSFFPLWLSIIFIDGMSIYENESNTRTEWISIICIVAAMCISCAIIYYDISNRGKEGSASYNLKTVQEEKAITAEYLLSYILPLFAFDFTLWTQTFLFLIFFVTLGYLHIRHRYFNFNIILEFVGYRCYQCELESVDNMEKRMMKKQLVISKQQLKEREGEGIDITPLNNEYALDVSQRYLHESE